MYHKGATYHFYPTSCELYDPQAINEILRNLFHMYCLMIHLRFYCSHKKDIKLFCNTILINGYNQT